MSAPVIRVRAYNVGFGDCFLVSIPDGAAIRRILVDFGNAPGRAGSNAVFADVAADIERESEGRLDALVVTHEHLDHLEGFYAQRAVFDRMRVDQVWMGIASHPDYYTRICKEAEPHRKLRLAAASFARSVQRRGVPLAPSFESLLRNNLSNAQRLDYLRGLGRRPPRYLNRGSSIRSVPASTKVKIRVLAPERKMTVYYGGALHALMGMAAALRGTDGAGDAWTFPRVPRVAAPPQLSPAAWARLRETIQGGGVQAVRALDKAENNTSLVLLIEAHGKRLLFTGDAELESWRVMKEKCAQHLAAVDFFKVSHHGSHNGTPLDQLDSLLPKSRKDRAQVMVSTKSRVYGTVNPVPDEALLEDLRGRCKRLVSTEEHQGLTVDLEI